MSFLDRCAAIILVLCLAGFPALASAATLRVSTQGDDAGDGLSWATAKRTVTAGLAAAVADDQVWVAAGTYAECITLKAGVALYGGFTGNETQLEQRDWATNVTVIDGNAAGSVVTIANGATSATRIDGFTIRNGSGSPIVNDLLGGGVYCPACTAVIANNTITSNTADAGAGIYCMGGAPTITHNALTGNVAQRSGAAICCSNSAATISGNTMSGNAAGNGSGYGGAICCSSGSAATIVGNLLNSNTAGAYGYGGGIWCGLNSGCVISSNTIVENTAGSGGGLACRDSAVSISGNVIQGNMGSGISCSGSSWAVTGNTIAQNKSTGGAGISCSGVSWTIANNLINGNIAENGFYDTSGGGIGCSGVGVIANNVIAANAVIAAVATRGGGIDCSGSAIIANNTIIANTTGAGSDSGGGGIACGYNSTPQISNNIVAFNSSGILGVQSAAALRSNCVYNPLGVNYSGLSAGTGDTTVDPQLQAAEYGQFHLQPASPCRDSGDASVVQSGWLDMDGEPRALGGVVDIGADEFSLAAPDFVLKVVRVNPLGNDAQDGSSWELAKRTVQAAVDAVAAQGGGDVWVAAGAYQERISLKAWTHIYGGFAGSESDRAQRTWVGNLTIVDGGLTGAVVTAPAGSGLSRVDGFALRNGKGIPFSGYSQGGSWGGGVWCCGCMPVISNNTITGNRAAGDGDGRGAGIYSQSAAPTITRNIINSNVASSSSVSAGGGLYLASSSGLVVNNAITGNIGGFGAGICCLKSSSRVVNNVVSGNAATGTDSGGGGIYCYGAAIIANNTLVGNTAHRGGGIFCCESSSPLIVNNLVAFNSSGIHVWIDGSPILRKNCFFNAPFYDYSGVSPGPGDISADPQLLAYEYGEVHLTAGSPCIDAGDTTTVQPGELDIDGENRVQGEHVDIGADEFNGTTPPFTPTIVHVRPAGDDAQDGSTWAQAKRTVQSGIDAASIAGGGEVWVAEGTYQERITLKSWVRVYGGFAGAETARDQRNWTTRFCTLNGNSAGTVVTVSLGSSMCALDGFTIRNGSGTGGYGGGVSCSSASPRLANLRITECTATYGGGMYCVSSSPVVANVMVTGCSASTSGGGLHIAAGSSPLLLNCALSGSQSPSGAAVYHDSSSAGASLTNCTIAGNTGSAAIYNKSGTPNLINCIVWGNATPQLVQQSGIVSTAYSCIQGGWNGTGNISADPRLVSVGTADLRLRSGSPCIDAGNNAAVPSDVSTDISESSRFVDDPTAANTGDAGTPPRVGVDMGAYEYAGDPAERLYVNDDAPGGDGSSWATAYVHLQDALSAARARLSVTEIWVAAGTYKPDRDAVHPSGTGDRAAIFELLGGVAIRGGFSGLPGQEGDVTARNPAVYKSILSGDLDGNDGPNFTNRAGNAYHVVSAGLVWDSAIIDGVNICAGNANGTSPNNLGGGVYLSGGSPTLMNCALADNSAAMGGALYTATATPTLLNCILQGNSASTGGAVYNTSGSPQMVNCTLTGNLGRFAKVSSTPGAARFTNCVLWGNAAPLFTGTVTVTYSCVEGGYTGQGNTALDPLLVSAAAGDLRLSATSPCIDAGSNSAVPGGTLFDAAGRVRFMDIPGVADCPYAPGTCGTAPIVDMGAYEFIPAITGDFDTDGDVDEADLSKLAACMLGPGMGLTDGCDLRELDEDEDIDLDDFGIFQRCYSGYARAADANCGD